MWIDQYIKFMFPVNEADVRLDAAMQLKLKHLPQSLYKYRAVSENSLDNLLNDTIWVTNASNFNDPYDCALTLDLTDSLERNLSQKFLGKFPEIMKKFNLNLNLRQDEIDKLSNSDFKEILDKMVNSVEGKSNLNKKQLDFLHSLVLNELETYSNSHLEMTKDFSQRGTLVHCFSEVNNSILMWSHYANNHSGFCIEYNFKNPNIVPFLVEKLHPVKYSNEILDITNFYLEPNFNKFVSIYAAIIKSKEWNYEKEWRIVFPIGKEISYNYPLFSPEVIYLGSRIKDEDKETLIQIAKKKNISVFQMTMLKNKFKLISEKII
jgi:hypothetical protein